MKEIYIDLMEMALDAYTEERIAAYLADVKRDGLREHGFPRLTVNIGILIAHGRRTELLPLFIEMMDICCTQIPTRQAKNDFSVKEICFMLLLLTEVDLVKSELVEKWREQLRTFDPWKLYKVIAPAPDDPCGNWAAFNSASEFMRMLVCGVDSTDFLDWQLSSQMLAFDENGMYQDPDNPIMYDYITRVQMAVLLHFGYHGKFREQIEKQFDLSGELSAAMQSVTGEMAFGGRSNQFLHNETGIAALYEFEAARYAHLGDMEKAGSFKASAMLAARAAMGWLHEKPISHIKNRYDIDSFIGCEKYGYFNKYMITLASEAYLAYLFADDSIVPTISAAERGGYIARTGRGFHKIFLNAGGYFLEFDTDADEHYDANGLGRIHKEGCDSRICLSVPFPSHPKYGLEQENPGGMSLCCYAHVNGADLFGADSTKYTLTDSNASADTARLSLRCDLADSVCVTEEYTVSRDGVDIALSGYPDVGFMVPVFDFDGSAGTDIVIADHSVSVSYRGSRCVYRFTGNLSKDFTDYCNRNGRYRVYRVSGNDLHIAIERVEPNEAL